jgi:hypothetical protein
MDPQHPGRDLNRSGRSEPTVLPRSGLWQLLHPLGNGRAPDPAMLERLQHAEQSLRELIEGLPVGIFRYVSGAHALSDGSWRPLGSSWAGDSCSAVRLPLRSYPVAMARLPRCRATRQPGGAPPAPLEQAHLSALAAASAAQEGQEQLAFPYDVS